MKKTIPILILTAVLIGAVTLVICPLPTGTAEYTYTIAQDGATITGYYGTSAKIKIPSYLGGYPVVRIESLGGADKENHDGTAHAKLTSIILPNGIEFIGRAAFEGCERLTYVYIPASLICVFETFDNCPKLKKIEVSPDNKRYFSDSQGILYERGGQWTEWNKGNVYLTRCPPGKTGAITVPKNVTTISPASFGNCKNITSIDILSKETHIAGGAFEGCERLTSINIPAMATDIRPYTFKDCTSLTSITLPDSVDRIGEAAFSGCTSLTSITLPAKMKEIGESAFENCTALKEITIPSGVKEISGKTFSGCTSLASIEIPEKITALRYEAFMNCTSLTAVTFKNKNTAIVEETSEKDVYEDTGHQTYYMGRFTYRPTFLGCENLTTVYGIPDGAVESFAEKQRVTFIPLNELRKREFLYKLCAAVLLFEVVRYGNPLPV